VPRGGAASRSRWDNPDVADDQTLLAIYEELRLLREQHADQRAFMREITTRIERVAAEQIRELRDGRDQLRANTEATWRMLDRFDRLDPGGASPA
jgi:hypothetical protein